MAAEAPDTDVAANYTALAESRGWESLAGEAERMSDPKLAAWLREQAASKSSKDDDQGPKGRTAKPGPSKT